ncbi:hypothetical protein LOTGIDRAFT_238419 [Lottia gigantea]|uniref:EGF-like domain-containing protein n=1 Tax=Lottia gigantea TaxID=225164 RepID=V4AUF8_LOTGI|nr:hypothetical protein LOTGIDRAFT_238419 [Lottia gigantea]ESP00943.1 hypothetical protein LOTGIDRAFT_238419 [Lottia gigantea]
MATFDLKVIVACTIIIVLTHIQFGTCGECLPGYMGNDCNDTCSVTCQTINDDIYCDQITGRCTYGCIDGTFGDNCTDQCPEHCKDMICDRESGECSRGCEIGYYTDDCSKICSKSCENSACVGIDGDSKFTCSDGCSEGFTGADCSTPCLTPNCAMCTDASTCERCQKGFYGTTCDHTCKRRTSNCAECERSSGECVQCMPGYFGSACDQSCSNCYGGKCTIAGLCVEQCTKGYRGPFCNQSCPKNCEDYVLDGVNVTCNKANGLCARGCLKGFYGDKCNLVCPINCPESHCHQIDGVCMGEECLNDHYGNKTICDRYNGSCLYGCVSEWFGAVCMTPCGINCLPVSPLVNRTASNAKCKGSGRCPFGCQAGWKGVQCDIKTNDPTSISRLFQPSFYGIVTIVLIPLVLSVLQ